MCNSGSGWGVKFDEGTEQERSYESGLEYHEASSEGFPVPRVRTAMRIKGIPRHRLLDEGFLAMMLSQLSQLRNENSAAAVYDVLLPHLAGATLDVPMLDDGQVSNLPIAPPDHLPHPFSSVALPLTLCVHVAGPL